MVDFAVNDKFLDNFVSCRFALNSHTHNDYLLQAIQPAKANFPKKMDVLCDSLVSLVGDLNYHSNSCIRVCFLHCFSFGSSHRDRQVQFHNFVGTTFSF